MSWRLRSSITRRLAVLFAAVVMLTLAAVGSYLYRSLASQLEFRDDSELIGKVTQVRHLLEEARSIADIEKNREAFLNVVFAHEGLIFVLARANGDVLIQNVQAPAFPLRLKTVPVGREPTVTDISDWQTSAGPLRAIAARGAIGGRGGEELQILIAREGAERVALLADYRRDLIFAGIVGGLIASLLGWLTVRRGLEPVSLVAKKANEISSRKLDTRLNIDEAPQELRELTGAFNAMLDRLEDGVHRLSGFSADLAHDLRTPLNSLMLKSQVGLSRPRSADEYRALLESNIEEYERLSRIIESTLFLARADNAQLALQLETVNVRSTLDKVAEYFSGIAEEAGVTLAVNGEAHAVADHTLMERAVSNLVANGIRYTAPGSTLRITASEREDAVTIAVENPGADIASEHLDRVFDRYFRGDASRTESTASAGLGLSIVRAIMNLHEGEAQVASDGRTTRFTLVFPRGALSWADGE
jgi:two-component system, OmpR family, heavy metal sensor histidine kinase CusS